MKVSGGVQRPPFGNTPTVDEVLLSQSVLLNALTGNPTFVEIFSEFKPAQLPFVASFVIILVVRNLREPVAIEVLLINGDEPIGREEVVVNPPEGSDPIMFLTLSVGSITVSLEREVRILARIQGETVLERSYPVTVVGATLPDSADI